MGTRNLQKWFNIDLTNPDNIAAVFFAVSAGNPYELDTQSCNKYPTSIWCDLSREMFGSTDIVHRVRLYNLWAENRKGIRTKYFELSGKIPISPNITKGLKEDGVKRFRCFCQKHENRKHELTIIECDRCNRTYHAICVAGGTGAAKSLAVFICPICEGKAVIPPIFEVTPQQKPNVRLTPSVLRQASQAIQQGTLNPTLTTTTSRLKNSNIRQKLFSGEENVDHVDLSSKGSQSQKFDQNSTTESFSLPDIDDDQNLETVKQDQGSFDGQEGPSEGRQGNLNCRESYVDGQQDTFDENEGSFDGTERSFDEKDRRGEILTDSENWSNEKSEPKKKKGYSKKFKNYIRRKFSRKKKKSDENNSTDVDQDDAHSNASDNEPLDRQQAPEVSSSSSNNEESVSDVEVETDEKFPPFIIKVERLLWNRLMILKEEKVLLEDGSEVNVSHHSINRKVFHDHIFDLFNEVNKKCVPTCTSTKIRQPSEMATSNGAYLRVYASCAQQPLCTARYTITLSKIPTDSDNDVELCVRHIGGTITHVRGERAARQVQGERRAQFRKKLRNKFPSTVRAELFAEADIEVLKGGNFSKVPNIKVLQNIRNEDITKDELDPDPFTDLLLTALKMRNEIGKNFGGYIQNLSAIPFKVIAFTEDTLQAFRLVSMSQPGAILFFDATSSITKPMKPPHDDGRPFLYSLLLKSVEKQKPLAICEMITTDQSSFNITSMLAFFFNSYKRNYKDRRKYLGICQIETDFSIAIISSVIRTFERTTVEEYMQKIWRLMVNARPTEDFTCLHVCRWHFTKCFETQLKKLIKKKDPKRVEKLQLWTVWLIRLQQMKDLWTFDRLVFDAVIILADPDYSSEVQNRVENIQNPTLRDGNPNWALFDANDCNDETAFWERSPFGQYGKQAFEEYTSACYSRTTPAKPNPYKNHRLLRYLLTYILPYAPILSHALFELKHLPVIHDTQGHVENYFKLAKSANLHGKKTKSVAEFFRRQSVFTIGESKRFLLELPNFLGTTRKGQPDSKPSSKSTNQQNDGNQKQPSTMNENTDSGSRQNQQGKESSVKPLFRFPGKGSSSKSNPATKSRGFDFKGSLENIFNLGSSRNISSKTSKQNQRAQQSNKKANEPVKRTEKKVPRTISTENIPDTISDYSTDKDYDAGSQDFGKPRNQPKKSTLSRADKNKRLSPEFSEESFKKDQRSRTRNKNTTVLMLSPRIPYGGTFIYKQKEYKLLNTCPLDNFLQIMFSLYEYTAQGRSLIDKVQDLGGRALRKSIQCINKEQFAAAKAAWIVGTSSEQEKLNILQPNGIVNMWGSEAEVAWDKISRWFPIRQVSWCTNTTCPGHSQKDEQVVFPDCLIRGHIQQTINLFNSPYVAARRCEYCQEKRNKKYEFLAESPEILYYQCEGSNCLESDIIAVQNLSGITYELYAYTLRDPERDHFITVFWENGRKIVYDGLRPNAFELYEAPLYISTVVLRKRLGLTRPK